MDKDDIPPGRKVLSENLKALKAARKDLNTIEKIVLASDGKLTNGTVGRIHAASHTTDIDAVFMLAEVFNLEPWQLLVEQLNPKALPRLADVAVLGEIFDAVRQAGLQKPDKSLPVEPTHQVEQQSEPRSGPALDKAMKRAEGKGKSERGKTGGVQKSRTGRRVPGAPKPGRKR